MEVRLNDNSRLVFTWARPGLLNIEVWRAGSDRSGHGWLLQGSALLAGEDLQEFVSAINGPQEPEPLLAA